MNNRVFKYFNTIADKLSVGHDLSSTIKNPSDIGYSREKLVQTFLANHLPNRLSAILGGHIFGFDQLCSAGLAVPQSCYIACGDNYC